MAKTEAAQAVERVDITPDISLLRKAGEVNYTIPKAIAELVDNEIDARIPRKKLTVEVTVGQKAGKKFIKVSGNGSGMTREEAAKAMVMAHSAKKPGVIGEFGLGMKTAASNLGAHFEIITATKESKTALRLEYDEDDFIKRSEWKIDVEDVPKRAIDHGTIITITKLKVNAYPGVKNIILASFGKTFKHFIASGEVEILVNGEAVVPHVRDTIKEYDTEIDFEVNGKRVRGWAGLMTRGSGKGHYGFDLIRHNRVLTEHEKLGFTASPGLTRLTGELYLDDFQVTNNKGDFRRDTHDWDELKKRLEEDVLVDLKHQSRKLANPGKLSPKDEADVQEYISEVKDALKSEELQQDLDRRALDADLADEFAEGPIPFQVTAGEGEEGEEGELTRGSESTGGSSSGRRDEPSSVEQHRLNRVKTQLRNIEIEHGVARLGKESLYKIWDVEGVGAKKRLVVTTNQDHPIYSAFLEADFLLWVKINIAEAVAEFFTQSTGKTDAMLLVKSDIMKHIGKMHFEMMEQPATPRAEVDETTA